MLHKRVKNVVRLLFVRIIVLIRFLSPIRHIFYRNIVDGSINLNFFTIIHVTPGFSSSWKETLTSRFVLQANYGVQKTKSLDLVASLGQNS